MSHVIVDVAKYAELLGASEYQRSSTAFIQVPLRPAALRLAAASAKPVRPTGACLSPRYLRRSPSHEQHSHQLALRHAPRGRIPESLVLSTLLGAELSTGGNTVNTTDIKNSEQREAFAHRLVGDLMASMETLGVWLGLRLGLYNALDRAGASTAAELASTAGIDSRYAREWLEQQAVAGVLVTTDAGRDAGDRRYTLPRPHREVLLEEVSPYFVAPVTYALAGIARVLAHGVPHR
jgi:hypothetical protein